MRVFKDFSFLRNNRLRAVFFVLVSGVCVGLGILFFVFHLGGRNETITKSSLSSASLQEERQGKQASLSGKNCANAGTRPFAVMLSEDTEARPLSGIGQADIVVEMPVVEWGINRMMALYQCTRPSEIGSIRSARPDFIPLASGFDAVYAHWGGSHIALDELDRHVIDNLNALVNPFDIFYRKSWIPAPHNGFTSFGNLLRGAQGFKYSATDSFAGYPRSQSAPGSSPGKLVIQYASEVQYNYDPSSNSYARLRGGTPEKDVLTQQQVHADVVIVMRAQTRRLDANYNRVDITGQGKAIIFQNGNAVQATWRKDASKLSSKLMFLDDQGKEVPLVKGIMWIQVADPSTAVTWNGSAP